MSKSFSALALVLIALGLFGRDSIGTELATKLIIAGATIGTINVFIQLFKK